MLADGGSYVIRYDHRDTGRSVTDEPGSPGYTGADLVADAAGVLDAYAITAAHVVSVSGRRRVSHNCSRWDYPDRVHCPRPHQHVPRDTRSTASCPAANRGVRTVPVNRAKIDCV